MRKPLTTEAVKELANVPGFGRARQALIATGNWDEHAAPDGKKRKYSVRLTATAKASARVKVDARSKDKAEDLALELLDDNKAFARLSWDFEDLDDFEVEESDTKIISEEVANG